MSRRVKFGWLAGCSLLALVWWCSRERGVQEGREPVATRAAHNTVPANQVQARTGPKTRAITDSGVGRAPVSAGVRARERVSNTGAGLGELIRNERAILLDNAWIDTSRPLNLGIPDKLKAPAGNDVYIVQARGVIGDGFRSLLSAAGAETGSYIPNNAYLVRVNAAGVAQLQGSALVQSVLPYEPYYKLDASLLNVALTQPDLPPDVSLRVGVYGSALSQVLSALNAMGAEVVGQESGPFGPVLRVHPGADHFLAIAQLPGVMVLEPERTRQHANDLLRVRLGDSPNTVTNTNYLGLSGSNVIININDSGVDASHPDLSGRVSGSTTDNNGHGTHVAGTILGSGLESATVGTNASGSVSNASYRGLATNAQAFVIGMGFDTRMGAIGGAPPSDASVQQTAASHTNVFISNNSWDYGGSAGYDLAAASYDWAARDALPGVTGPQPLLFVFAAGNGGGGADDGTGGNADTISSPGAAKNVITVGALEQLRNLTNQVTANGTTNAVWQGETDSSNQVAAFSARGNVGVGIEGPAGRFKPDVVAPGVFVVSAKSSTWDQAAYFNPTNATGNTLFEQIVETNQLLAFSLFVPTNAVGVTLSLATNNFSPGPFPTNLLIYGRWGDNPTSNVFDFVTSNEVVNLPADGPLLTGATLFFSVFNNTNELVDFDLQTVVVTTNDDGNYLTVLSNLNAGLGPYYRYETGTSMAAAGVSGELALLQEFLEQRLGVTNHSPALLKAMLINGSRTVNGLYDLQVGTPANSQGWGLPVLANSIPAVLTNSSAGTNLPVRLFDETGSNALATGQARTWKVSLSGAGRAQPLRFTLVWTDPPGNPAAAVKLVNDLDLIVTNLDTGDVYWGNDIPAQSDFTETFGTNGPPRNDVVNNVENVYLQPPQGTNWSVTVSAHRVNVNTVTTNTNNVVQDYALVMGLGDGGGVSNGLTVTDLGTVSSNQVTGLVTITNGLPLLHQRAGANSQYAGTTNGVTNQWNFYVFTNTLAATNAAFTNVAFVTFAPPELGVARMGVFANAAEATRAEADIDLYVSQDPTLTNLNPAAINAAVQAGTVSVGRTGTEKVLLGNSTPNAVYYVGVKSEDQEGGEYGLVGVALTNSFNQMSNGNVVLTLLTALPAPIPPGTPANPGSVTVLAVTASQVQARKVVVIDTVTHQEFGDLVGGFSHGTKSVVLNNHSFFTNLNDPTETFTYDDSGENDTNFPNARMTDGPGSLKSFAGDTAGDGVWEFTMVNDSSAADQGSLDGFAGIIVPHTATNGFAGSVGANTWHYEFVDVPADATNLTITVGVSSGVSVDLYVRRGQFPDQTHFDEDLLGITPPGQAFNLNIFDSPPLNPGRYFIGIFNPNNVAAAVAVNWTFGYSLAAAQPLVVSSVGNEPLLDDAVTYSTNHVATASRVVSAEVGVRIDHPRESDLVLTLIDPVGTRVVLAENRGGLDTNGYGAGTDVTNVFPTTTSGTALAETNTLGTPTNQGTLVINYQFFTVPDDMRIYYDGARIFDSGLINGGGTFDVNFGPGSSTNLVIVMNEPGTNPSTNGGDLWDYTASVVTKLTRYAWFTEDTNKTTLPIKFAVPPFGALAGFTPAVTNVISTFDAVMAGDYTNTVDGWTVLDTNPVKVVTVAQLADTSPNVLALHYGSIQRTLPTVAGRSYTLTFVNHGRPNDTPVSWWKGEPAGVAVDSADGNTGTLFNGTTYAPGLVGQAFALNGTNAHVRIPDATNLHVSTGLTMETWINPADQNSDYQILSKWDAVIGPNQRDYGMAIGANGLPRVSITTNGLDSGETLAFSTIVAPVSNWTHVAGTYDGSALRIYVNGVLQQSVPATGTIFPGTDDMGIGASVGGEPPGGLAAPGFSGLIDEMTIYSNALSIVQVQDIYAAGSAGKCTNIGSTCPVLANVTLTNVTNITIVGNDAWTTNILTFTAPVDGTVLTINPLDNGMLLDSFVLVQNPIPNPGNYYLPEESLAKLTGDNAQGDWKLEVLDNRAGATNPTPTLVSWELSLMLDRVVPAAIPLVHAVPNSNTVAPNFFAYYSVQVPLWAQFATNILVNASGPVQIWFNQNQEPNGTNAGDISITNGAAPGGFALLSAASTPASLPPLAAGKTYYLGVQNLGAAAVNFTIEVDFDITTLTNLVPVTNLLAANGVPRYYQYDVSSNAAAVEFELFQKTGNVGLVARQGAPLPDLTHWDYASLGHGTNSDAIVVATNSTPVAPKPGRWYLGVFNQDVGLVNYTIEAVESGPPVIIVLTNDEVFTTNVPPGPDLGLFFEFDIPNTWTNTKALFELVNLNGNVDLTLQRGRLPYAAPYFASSGNPGTNNEQIVIRTNNVLTNLVANWFLGVPNNATSNVTFTIHAVVDTNGMLVSTLPLNPVPTLPLNPATGGLTLTWPTVAGETYEVEYSTNLVTWTPIPPPIVASGPTTVFTDPTPILSGGPARFYQIVQLPGP